MSATSSSIGLLFRIKGDSSEAVDAIKDVKTESTGLDTAATSLTGSFAGLASAGAIVGAGLLAVGSAALAVGKQIFSLTEAASEYGSEIFDASQKTGLSAETLSAMKMAADQSGASLDAVTGAAAKFAKTIGDAEKGSKEARATLERLGVTSDDVDVALGQALATIAKLPPGIQQMTAAQDAFGRSGAQLLPFIKSFDGDLVALTAKAKELGLTLTDEGAAAADEFGDQMDTLNAQIAAAGRTIGFSFMPIFLDMSRSLSGWLARNSGELELWGGRIARIFQNAIRGLQEVISFVQQNEGKIRIALAIMTLGASEFALKSVRDISALIEQDFQTYRADQNRRPNEAASDGQGIQFGEDDERSAADKRRKDREAAYKAELATLDKNIQLRLQKEREAFQDAQAMNEKLFFDRSKTETEFLQDSIANLKAYKENARSLISEAYRVDVSQAKGELERQNAKLQGERALQALNREIIRERDGAIEATKKQTKELADEEKKREKDREEFWEKEDQASQDAFNWQRKLWDIEQARYAAALKASEDFQMPLTLPDLAATRIQGPDDTGGGIFDEWTASWDRFMETVSTSAPNLKSIIGDVAGFIQNAFAGFANALGSVVEQWVLTGETGPAVMRKILASALAALAAEAAVRAVFELAMGFAALFLNPAEATAHFTAAALFGSIAVGAALAGRAIAPKNEGSKAFSGATAGGSSRGQDANQTPISRQSQDAFESRRTSGNPFQRAADHMTNVLDKLERKIDTAKPGDIFIAGIRQSPGAVGQAAVRDVQRDASIGTNWRRATQT